MQIFFAHEKSYSCLYLKKLRVYQILKEHEEFPKFVSDDEAFKCRQVPSGYQYCIFSMMLPQFFEEFLWTSPCDISTISPIVSRIVDVKSNGGFDAKTGPTVYTPSPQKVFVHCINMFRSLRRNRCNCSRHFLRALGRIRRCVSRERTIINCLG